MRGDVYSGEMLPFLCDWESQTGNWYSAGDIDELVRRLDVALNGEHAAKQSMLCDIVSQVESNQPQAVAVPNECGLRLVPFDPTQEMQQAGDDAVESNAWSETIWHQMLSAAPEYTSPRITEQDVKTVVAALVKHIERETCLHEETHRGGVIWEICNSCGQQWADDNGSKPEFKWPSYVDDARTLLNKLNTKNGDE